MHLFLMANFLGINASPQTPHWPSAFRRSAPGARITAHKGSDPVRNEDRPYDKGSILVTKTNEIGLEQILNDCSRAAAGLLQAASSPPQS